MRANNRIFHYIGILFLSFIVLSSCEGDDKHFEQYFNSMGNNPMFTLPWMNNVRKSLFKKQAAVVQYNLEDKTYFVAYAYYPPNKLNGMITQSCIIYQNNSKEPVIFFESSNVLDESITENAIYRQFIEASELSYILWKNTPKNEEDILEWGF